MNGIGGESLLGFYGWMKVYARPHCCCLYTEMGCSRCLVWFWGCVVVGDGSGCLGWVDVGVALQLALFAVCLYREGVRIVCAFLGLALGFFFDCTHSS